MSSHLSANPDPRASDSLHLGGGGDMGFRKQTKKKYINENKGVLTGYRDFLLWLGVRMDDSLFLVSGEL